MVRSAVPWLLLAILAGARLHLQMAALPPYAGLDEIYHAARLAFVLQESRNPTMDEPSIPPYLAASIAGDSQALPAFGVIGAEWPRVVRERDQLLPDRTMTAADLRAYAGTNYEAQQPSLYYVVAAPLAGILPERTPLTELRCWRGFSAFCALVVVLATAVIGWKVARCRGLLAAALLVSLPTWLTLVVRAGNDAFACMLIALALMASLRAPVRPAGIAAEGILWAGALAAKLYSWPVAVTLPFIWNAQRATRRRWLVVAVCGIAAVGATVADLTLRTRNPLGLFAFDRPEIPLREPVPIAWGEMIRIVIASFAWTSGQHVNALRPLAIALYLGPVLLIVAFVLIGQWRQYRGVLLVCGASVAAFAIAQAVNAAGYIRSARMEGMALPAGGKEGWYWYALAPLGIGVVLALVLRHLPRAAVVVLVVWMAAWDVAIHEGALFQDFAGVTSPAAGDSLVRWGPRSVPFTRDLELERVSVGPGVRLIPLFRALHLCMLAALCAGIVRRLTPKHNEPTLTP